MTMRTASILKKLNLDVTDFEELLFDHSIVDVSDEVGNIVYANKNFCDISKITPQYFQAATLLQDECMKTCEKTISASASMQQEFAKKAGITSDIPNEAKTAMVETNKQIVQVTTVNTQLVKTVIDTTVQNIQR